MSRDRNKTPRHSFASEPDRTPEEERQKFAAEWAAVAEQRAALARIEAELAVRTPVDVALPKLAVPVELPPKVLWGAIVGFLTVAISVIGGAAALYWKAGVHMGDATIHVMEPDGIPVMVKRVYETATASKEARAAIVHEVEVKVRQQHQALKHDLVRAIAPQRYARWKMQEEQTERRVEN